MSTRNTLIFPLLIAAALGCHRESTTETSSSTATPTDTSVASATTDTTGTSSTLPATASTTATTLSHDDQEFVTKAAEGGMAEVSLGNLAASKGVSADVKAFGNRMATDHGKANDELKTLASGKGVVLPVEMDKESKETSDKLSGKSGKDFDKEYMEAMVKDHEKDVKEFEKASKDAKDPDVKAWAAKTLPTLQDHLKMAKETEKKVK